MKSTTGKHIVPLGLNEGGVLHSICKYYSVLWAFTIKQKVFRFLLGFLVSTFCRNVHVNYFAIHHNRGTGCTAKVMGMILYSPCVLAKSTPSCAASIIPCLISFSASAKNFSKPENLYQLSFFRFCC